MNPQKPPPNRYQPRPISNIFATRSHRPLILLIPSTPQAPCDGLRNLRCLSAELFSELYQTGSDRLRQSGCCTFPRNSADGAGRVPCSAPFEVMVQRVEDPFESLLKIPLVTPNCLVCFKAKPNGNHHILFWEKLPFGS